MNLIKIEAMIKENIFCVSRMRSFAVRIFAMAVPALLLPGCTKNYFNAEVYDTVLEESFPVSDVDQNHSWRTISSNNINISLEKVDSVDYDVCIYDADPEASSEVTELLHVTLPGTASISASYSYESLYDVVCVVVDSAGYIVNKENLMPALKSNISLGSSLSKPKKFNSDVKDFSWRYCFEDCFPSYSTDYDFNDIVLTMNKFYDSEEPSIVYLYVSLDAVGTQKGPLQAALHLNGITPSEISLFEVEKSFDFYSQLRSNINEEVAGYTIGRNGDVVIPLFNDAHVAMFGSSDAISGTGVIARKYVNTVGASTQDEITSNSDLIATESVKSAIFKITFKSESSAWKLTATNVDAFIAGEYNGNFFETHCYPYKRNMTLYEFASSEGGNDFFNNPYPWGFMLPSDFKYPQEGVAIGSNKSKYVGAYNIKGYNFASWAQDEETSPGWYRYALNNRVYN